MKTILEIQIADEYFDEIMCKQSQGGAIKAIDGKIFCTMPYEDVQNGQIVDVSNTDEYKTKIADAEKEAQKNDFLRQIEELDKKRIRAIAEPQLMDGTSGETWLDFYTKQIQTVREKIASI